MTINHFNKQSSAYSDFRPTYPKELFTQLHKLSPENDLCWDVATGTGQAAHGLAHHFKQVVATDASASQIHHAGTLANIDYRTENAEQSSLKNASVDLISVAQAFHWLDHLAFFTEVNRVLKPRGILAVWGYDLIRINPDIDEIVDEFYWETIHEFWPKERHLLETHYQTINFPYEKIETPKLTLTQYWDAKHFLGYLSTWSAVKIYQQKKQINPLKKIQDKILSHWNLHEVNLVSWPLFFHITRKPLLLESAG